MAMTREQARRYIEEAEKNPESIDRAKLEEAIQVLAGPSVDASVVVSAAVAVNPAVWAGRGLFGLIEYVARNSEASGGTDVVSPIRTQADVIRALQGEPAPADEDRPIRTRADATAALARIRREDADLIDRAGALLAAAETGVPPEDMLPETGGQPPFQPSRPPADLVPGLDILEGAPTRETPIPADLTRQFRNAAADAGMTPAQIDAELAQLAQLIAEQPDATDFLLTQFRAQIDDLKAQAPLGPKPIGVDRDFVAQLETDISPQVGFRDVPSVQDVDPRYFEGDEFSPAGLSPDETARIQSRLEAAGLLEPGGYWAGTWDNLTSNAYKSALGMSNQSGVEVEQTIDRLIATLPESIKEQRARAEAAETFQAPPFIRPDREALAQRVKDEFRSMLGREPTPEDLSWAVSGLGADFRQQYESEVAAARSQFEAGLGQGPAGGVIQGVDPMARFRSSLEQRFGAEIDRLEMLPQVRDNMDNVFASLTTMGNLVDR